jgi:hypothetical protein
MKLPFEGGCLCGSVRYECSSAPLGMGNCHCRDCQKARGAPFSPVFATSVAAFMITKGSAKDHVSKADDGTVVHRAFCPDCGTPLYAFSEPTKEFIGVLAMTLDDASWFKPMIDIWTSSAQPWVAMHPETKKYPQDFMP